jgi:hypothetical protein
MMDWGDTMGWPSVTMVGASEVGEGRLIPRFAVAEELTHQNLPQDDLLSLTRDTNTASSLLEA